MLVFFWGNHFLDQMSFFVNFQRKCFKTPEKHRIAVCGSIRGTKQFSSVFVQIHVFYEKIVAVNSGLISDIATIYHITVLCYFLWKWYKTPD